MTVSWFINDDPLSEATNVNWLFVKVNKIMNFNLQLTFRKITEDKILIGSCDGIITENTGTYGNAAKFIP